MSNVPMMPSDGSFKCLCGKDWVERSETPWGVKFKCEDGHTYLDRTKVRQERTKPLEKILVKTGAQGIGEFVRTGVDQPLRDTPRPSLWLRFRVWWWRTFASKGGIT